MQQCPDCLLKGNSLEFGQQRGIIVHGSHLTTVEENVLYDIRGANIYVEDGNEMHNKINFNVGICPNFFSSPSSPGHNGPEDRRGCTVPGTDNPDSDTSSNQAGIWALGSHNTFIGNRMANHFNGLFFQPGLFPFGRGLAANKLCTGRLPFGRISGNTNHGNGRFGLYFLTTNYPKKVLQSVESGGLVEGGGLRVPADAATTCSFADAGGFDNGRPVSALDNVDYGNAFVGGYDFGDIQLRGSQAFKGDNVLYWKETKNMADGCSAHVMEAVFEDGNLALPDVRGTFLMEGVTFSGGITLEANHHCGVGSTGLLCNPQYVLLDPDWRVSGQHTVGSGIFLFDVENKANDGGVFALAPTHAVPDPVTGVVNPKGLVFPPGYQALVGPSKLYLLPIDGGRTCVEAAGVPGVRPDFVRSTRPTNDNRGILCKKPVRRLNIWSKGPHLGDLRISVLQGGTTVSQQAVSRWRTGQTLKQGYGFAVVLDSSLQYRITLASGGRIPADWVVEFSDPIMGNRFGVEHVRLDIPGRPVPSAALPVSTSFPARTFVASLRRPSHGMLTILNSTVFRDCGQSVTSQHDRLWLDGNMMDSGWSDASRPAAMFGDPFHKQWGRGACTGHPGEKAQPALPHFVKRPATAGW